MLDEEDNMIQREIALNDYPQTVGTVIYWMSRDQRVDDNWALLYAQAKALEMNRGLLVVFCKSAGYLGSMKQQNDFMMAGLQRVYLKLRGYKIPFVVLEGDPVENIIGFVSKIKTGLLVTDFNPLKISRGWKEQAAKRVKTRFVEVDAHNVIPCFAASNKQEFAAYTFRPKSAKKLNGYLTDFPVLINQPFEVDLSTDELTSFNETTQKVFENLNNKYPIKSGEAAAKEHLNDFFASRLKNFSKRNDPNEDACSGLSPYLHFGQISAQRVALETMKLTDAALDFLEELIVRRELSDNYCYYNKNYDNFEGFPEWAKKTLNEHWFDPREFLYKLEQLENAATHDALWNAAQMEMVKTGKMHGYLRMYWAKKILEWSDTVEQAMQNAIILNDRYQLDGRDPNGYTGIAWSMGGVHDRAWGERNIFGKIRYMLVRKHFFGQNFRGVFADIQQGFCNLKLHEYACC
jgi:deoxyribodipyrimidine photo-lyase